jgi:hypothetical protein
MDKQTIQLVAAALLEAEWTTHGGPVYSCRGCHHSWSFQRVHAPECRVDAALTALGYPDTASRDRGRRELSEADQVKRYGRVMVRG